MATRLSYDTGEPIVSNVTSHTGDDTTTICSRPTDTTTTQHVASSIAQSSVNMPPQKAEVSGACRMLVCASRNGEANIKVVELAGQHSLGLQKFWLFTKGQSVKLHCVFLYTMM